MSQLNPARPLTGRIALVTGASRGLGASMAIALGNAGATVLLIARDQDRLNENAATIRANGGTAFVHAVDITQENQVLQLADTVRATHGSLHILINNAGVNHRKPITEFTLAEWQRVIDTNLTSVFLLCRSFVPLLKGHGYGRILNMTSIMSHIALPGRTAYCASKTALLGLTRALALELAPDQITVNGISPGPFATEMNQPILDNPELNSQFISKIPLGRWGKVDDIGQLAVYLCSDAASFITGTDIRIDGGWTTQ